MYLIDLEQFDSTNEVCIHGIGEQTLHQVIQRTEKDVGSFWRAFTALYLNKQN